METTNKIRQPIVTVAGHVDSGKTSILDAIRGTKVATGEAGGITQKISFTLFPKDKIIESCPIFQGKGEGKLEIPGFLFIDTPGHAAFTNLRKRGGSLADLAILVVNINEGIMPQTAEVISIFKTNKTPFIIALNKIDAINGWKKNNFGLKEGINSQASHVKANFEEKLYTFMGALNSHGFDAELYYNVEDYTKNIVMVPCSARTGEGIPELLTMLCGLSQKFLKDRLKLGQKPRGVILEVKKEKTVSYAETILYDGILTPNDEIAVATISGEPIVTRIRTMEEIQPLSNKFRPVSTAIAATGLRIQLTSKTDILPGMPFLLHEDNIEEIRKEFAKEITQAIQIDKEGIIVKAESLGSLEAVLTLLRQNNIRVVKAGIGNISKSDVISAKTNLESENPENAIILGFNVNVEPDAEELLPKKAKIFLGEVVYNILDEIRKWQEERQGEILKEKLLSLTSLFKLEILPKYVFRNSNPSIFGVRVLGGRVKANAQLIDNKNEKIGRIKALQEGKQTVQEASVGKELAISIPGQNFERHLSEIQYLYSDISNKQYREFRKNKGILTSEELNVLREIAQIKGF